MKAALLYVILFFGVSLATTAIPERAPLCQIDHDRLGEDLQTFLLFHKDADCASPDDGTEESSKPHQSSQMVCVLKNGLIFDGETLTENHKPDQSFGLVASFYFNRLTEVTFTLETDSLDKALPRLKGRYGEPVQLHYSKTGKVYFAEWKDAHDRTLLIAEPAMPSADVDEDDDAFAGGPSTSTRAIRITVKGESPINRKALLKSLVAAAVGHH